MPCMHRCLCTHHGVHSAPAQPITLLRAHPGLCRVDIDRELMGLKREEAQLIREIKAEAKKNNTAGAKAMAKSLVRLRGQMAKLLAAKGQLKGVQTQITVRRLHGMSR